MEKGTWFMLVMYLIGEKKVTDILWFIYNLEQKAKQAGGQVHFVFGNHELMVLDNNYKYIHDKYEDLCETLHVEYGALFHPNSVLGEWLRTRNSIIKINDVLFVHGGISKYIAKEKLFPNEVNDLIQYYVLAGVNEKNGDRINLINDTKKGVFWYRGYFKEKSKYFPASNNDVKFVLDTFDANTIIVGHTEFDVIDSYYNGSVINVNIPLRDKEVPNQAVIIKDGHFYRWTQNEGMKMMK